MNLLLTTTYHVRYHVLIVVKKNKLEPQAYVDGKHEENISGCHYYIFVANQFRVTIIDDIHERHLPN